MKKLFTVLVMAFMVGLSSVNAQVKFGVKGGVNLSNFSFSEKIFDESNRTGFFIGPTVKFTLPIVGLGIDASALYDQRSAELSVFATSNAATKETIKQQQIAIPINVRYSFGLGQTASIFLFAGPQFGFNIGDKDKKLFDSVAEWSLKSSTFSVNAGVGVMLLNHLQIAANYNFACGKTGEIKLKDGIKDKANANVWQLSLAYYF